VVVVEEEEEEEKVEVLGPEGRRGKGQGARETRIGSKRAVRVYESVARAAVTLLRVR
jgi:hypothetical protein